MPSATHESVVALFRECPALAPELLRVAECTPPAASTTPRVISAEFADLDVAEYRADVVIRLDTPGHQQSPDDSGDRSDPRSTAPVKPDSGPDTSHDSQAEEAIIVEVQLDTDRDKRYSWPIYIGGVRARLRCPTTLLVITLQDSVASWCRTPITLDRHQPGSIIRPIVLGPRDLPRVTDLVLARQLPELAILSAASHARSDDEDNHATAELAWTALQACGQLDSTRATRYTDFILASLGAAARRILEEQIMGPQKYEYQSDFAKKYFGEGRQAGHREGALEGVRGVLLDQLGARFGELSDSVRHRIEQADLDDLQRWSRRVIEPDITLADVFDQDP